MVGAGVGTAITYNEHVNVAVAVAMPDGGLITPVLRSADSTDMCAARPGALSSPLVLRPSLPSLDCAPLSDA